MKALEEIMSEDKLEETKAWSVHEWRKWLSSQGGISFTPRTDFRDILNNWEGEKTRLISEIEKCREISFAKTALIKAQTKVAIKHIRETRQLKAEINSSKAVLTYNLPEEAEEFRQAVDGGKAFSVLWEIAYNLLRPIWKHRDLNEEQQKLIDEVCDGFWEVLAEHGVTV